MPQKFDDYKTKEDALNAFNNDYPFVIIGVGVSHFWDNRKVKKSNLTEKDRGFIFFNKGRKKVAFSIRGEKK